MFKKLLLTTALIQLAFSVAYAQPQGCPQIVDQNQGSANSGTNGNDQWQSFTAGASGWLTKIEVDQNGCQSGSGTITVYAGSGVAGTVLYTSSFAISGCSGVAPINIAVGNLQVTQGNIYTFRLQTNIAYGVTCHTGSLYSGGTYYSDVYGAQNTWDLLFRTWVNATTYPPASTTPTGTVSICQGGNATLNANTGANLVHQWEQGGVAIGGATNATYSAFTPANYTVRVIDNVNNCWNTSAPVTVVVNPLPSISLTPTNVTCNGLSNGSISSNVTNGTPAYSYSWTPTGGSTANATNLAAGSYTLSVIDSKGCSAGQSATVGQPNVLTASGSGTNATCNGTATGSATVTVTGGVGPYSYSWAPGGGTSNIATGLSAATYTCTIVDANGCTTTKTIIIAQPTVLSSSSSKTNVSCAGGTNGSATVTASGGTGPYSYSWAPSGGTSATASNLSAGSYTCTITDANGCTTTQSAIILQPSAITSTSSQTNINCFGNATGSATVTVSGGTVPYFYSWSPAGGTTNTATGLTAATYTCNVTDNNGCVHAKTVTITEPTLLSTSISKTDETCFMSGDGTATVTANGGTLPYTYSWLPSGATTAIAINLSAGTHTSQVTDANGCTSTQTVIINQPALLSSIATPTDASCFGSANGSASVTVTGGTPSYIYSWSPAGGTSANATGLTAGNYTCSITDANGCVATQTVIINEPSAISTSYSQLDVSCNAGADGSATVTATGGTPSYTFSWSPTGGSSATATSLMAGSYTCTVTDANGCTGVQVVAITEPTALTISSTQTDVSCNAGADGTATVTVTGGTGSCIYSWSPTGGTLATAIGLTAGSYTCSAADLNGCPVSTIVVITEPTVISISTTQTDVSCFAGTNGSATVTATGGTPTYTYSWLPSGGTGATETGLATGVYSVTATDVNGCTASASVTITEPAQLSTSFTSNNATCFGSADGNATVTPTGGIAPYSYTWSPITNTTATASNLAAGSYTCAVTDANGCSSTAIMNISQSSALNISISTVSTVCGANNGSATATVIGGVGPYIYQWSNGSITTLADSLIAGQYLFQVYDANNCYASAVAMVTASNGPGASPLITNVSCNGGNDGAILANVLGGTTPYTYTWSTGSTASSLNALVAGVYDLEVVDANGCSVVTAVTVTEPSPISLSFSVTDANCGQADGSVTAVATGGTGAYSYLWSANAGSQTTATASSLAGGVYTLTVTDAASCTAIEGAIVNSIGSTLAISVASVTDNDCGTIPTGAVTTASSGGTAPVTYLWNNGATTANISGIATGTYYVTVTDANNCSASASATINSSISTTYQPEICIVTVDTGSYKNYVIWEKPALSGINAFNIYRETSVQNSYLLIGTVPFDSLSQYEDLDVADPQVKSWRYKISAVDSCGEETGLSQSHKTIHLTQTNGVTAGTIDLSWDFYSGFNYVTFYVWRNDTTTGSGWTLIDSLPSTQYTYTDLTPSSMNAVYMIEVEQTTSCNPTRAIINTSRSNVKGQIAAPPVLAVKDVKKNELMFGAYPNPTNDNLTVNINNGTEGKMTLRVYDAIGQIALERTYHATSVNDVIDMKNLANGLYVLEVRASGSVKQLKVIKQ